MKGLKVKERKGRRGFGTIAVTGGEEDRFAFNPASTPIYQTSTFFSEDPEGQAGPDGLIYTRIGNPTVGAFEDKMAMLEGGEAAVACASGMAATSAVILEFVRPGDEIISSSRIYGGSRLFFGSLLGRLGCAVRYFSPDDDYRKTIPALITKKTRLIFYETPSNPELSIVDNEVIGRIGRRHGLVSVIDNTFATPYLQRPLGSGIDCIVHSATKYIGGHGDSIGGIVVSSKETICRIRQTMLLNMGGCISPFNAWLFIRGLRTLHVRMDLHCSTAAQIAEFLQGEKKVKEVLYPGLKKHPGYAVAKRQMKAFGGVVSLRLAGREACRRFLKGLDLCKIGVSLGDTSTLALNAALMFHSDKSDDACRRLGVDPTLIRISTGLEDTRDVIVDIKNALKKV